MSTTTETQNLKLMKMKFVQQRLLLDKSNDPASILKLNNELNTLNQEISKLEGRVHQPYLYKEAMYSFRYNYSHFLDFHHLDKDSVEGTKEDFYTNLQKLLRCVGVVGADARKTVIDVLWMMKTASNRHFYTPFRTLGIMKQLQNFYHSDAVFSKNCFENYSFHLAVWFHEAIYVHRRTSETLATSNADFLIGLLRPHMPEEPLKAAAGIIADLKNRDKDPHFMNHDAELIVDLDNMYFTYEFDALKRVFDAMRIEYQKTANINAARFYEVALNHYSAILNGKSVYRKYQIKQLYDEVAKSNIDLLCEHITHKLSELKNGKN